VEAIVSAALRRSMSADGTWMLHGDPPETFEPLREAAAGE
jgi:hypothetical protein